MSAAYVYYQLDGGFWVIGEEGMTQDELSQTSDRVEIDKYVKYVDYTTAMRAGYAWRAKCDKDAETIKRAKQMERLAKKMAKEESK